MRVFYLEMYFTFKFIFLFWSLYHLFHDLHSYNYAFFTYVFDVKILLFFIYLQHNRKNVSCAVTAKITIIISVDISSFKLKYTRQQSKEGFLLHFKWLVTNLLSRVDSSCSIYVCCQTWQQSFIGHWAQRAMSAE